jgi:hypothetical protein
MAMSDSTLMTNKKPGRPRIGRKLKTPDDYGDTISIRIPHGNKRTVNAIKAIAKREGKTIGEIWIEAATLIIQKNVPKITDA